MLTLLHKFGKPLKVIKKNNAADENLYTQIVEGCEKSLAQLMDNYIDPLCDYVMYFTHSKDLAEEVVADVFINLWRIRKSLNIQSSLRAYLYKACRNRALDLLEKEKMHLNDDIDSFRQIRGGISPELSLNIKDLNRRIDSLISEMPHQKQIIFRMSRIDGLKYSEIAEILSISVNTVQNHMVEAVKFMAKRKVDIE